MRERQLTQGASRIEELLWKKYGDSDSDSDSDREEEENYEEWEEMIEKKKQQKSRERRNKKRRQLRKKMEERRIGLIITRIKKNLKREEKCQQKKIIEYKEVDKLKELILIEKMKLILKKTLKPFINYNKLERGKKGTKLFLIKEILIKLKIQSNEIKKQKGGKSGKKKEYNLIKNLINQQIRKTKKGKNKYKMKKNQQDYNSIKQKLFQTYPEIKALHEGIAEKWGPQIEDLMLEHYEKRERQYQKDIKEMMERINKEYEEQNSSDEEVEENLKRAREIMDKEDPKSKEKTEERHLKYYVECLKIIERKAEKKENKKLDYDRANSEIKWKISFIVFHELRKEEDQEEIKERLKQKITIKDQDLKYIINCQLKKLKNSYGMF